MPTVRRILTACCLLLAWAAPAASAETVVSLTFDRGLAGQAAALPLLAEHGMPATFFVSSLDVGRPGRLTWGQLSAMSAAGHEIGGRTATEAWLPALTAEQRRHEICDDRDALLAKGLPARSFAYPWGGGGGDPIVGECGYGSGRGLGGVGCPGCSAAESLPPWDRFYTGTTNDVVASTSLAQLQAWVVNAENAGGGWVQLPLGDVCTGCGENAIAPATLDAFLDWLAARSDRGTRVRTVGDAVGATVAPATMLPRSRPVVTLGFDDGTADQLAARTMLSARGLKATFYVNSGNVGRAGFLTWAQLTALAGEGNEIGGHTANHVWLPGAPAEQVRSEVCGDRSALRSRGFAALSFAYPYGGSDDTAAAAVRDCGYLSGRELGGIACVSCTYAETIPPRWPFASPSVTDVQAGTPLEDVQRAILNAEALGGGWVQLVLHRVCDGCGTFSVPPARLDALLSWLGARNGVTLAVRTAAQVTGAAPPDPPDPPQASITAPAPGSALNRKETVEIRADASGPSGVASVRFLDGGSSVGIDSASPWSVSWRPGRKGTHLLTAVAVDAAGREGTSSVVSVTAR